MCLVFLELITAERRNTWLDSTGSQCNETQTRYGQNPGARKKCS